MEAWRTLESLDGGSGGGGSCEMPDTATMSLESSTGGGSTISSAARKETVRKTTGKSHQTN